MSDKTNCKSHARLVAMQRASTATVPDANFRAFLVATYAGTSQSGNTVTFTTPSVTDITTMDCSNQNISDLTGIQNFTALENLNCSFNALTTLNVSANIALQELRCFNNQLTSLDVSGATALQLLGCSDNQLTSLDVSNNTALTILECDGNQLTSLDVSNNTALQILLCYDNRLTGALNLSANTALSNLQCQNNKIPIILTDNDGIASITKDALTQVAVFRSNNPIPSVPPSQQGAFVLGTTGAIVNFTTGSDDGGELVGSTGANPSIVPPLPSGTDRISPDKFWTINQSTLSNFTYNLILDLRAITGITAFNLLKVLKRDNNTVPWQDVAQAPINATVQYLEPFILINGLTSFSEFSIGGGGVDNPLPVELVNFTGAATRNGVQLRWTTASEQNNAGFEVRRSEAGSDFQTIASYAFSPELKGRGTVTSATNYEFLDASVEAGKTYAYRLRSVDYDGTLHDYAQTVTVEVREPVQPKVYEYALWQNYPNPFNPTTTIRFTMKEAGAAMLTITDVLGRVVLTETIQASVGENAYRFVPQNLGSGVYFYTLRAGAFQQTKKMMLVK